MPKSIRVTNRKVANLSPEQRLLFLEKTASLLVWNMGFLTLAGGLKDKKIQVEIQSIECLARDAISLITIERLHLWTIESYTDFVRSVTEGFPRLRPLVRHVLECSYRYATGEKMFPDWLNVPVIPPEVMDRIQRSPSSDEILRTARLDAERAYRDLTPYRISLTLESDGWHVDYILKDPNLNGGGPRYVIDPQTGAIRSKKYEQ